MLCFRTRGTSEEQQREQGKSYEFKVLRSHVCCRDLNGNSHTNGVVGATTVYPACDAKSFGTLFQCFAIHPTEAHARVGFALPTVT